MLRPRLASRRLRRWLGIICRFLLAAGLLLCWPGAGPAAAAQIKVAATILPLGDFCRQIGGDLVQVQVLIPPGASPHVFEPSPSAMARAFQAQVFVYVGAGLEPWAQRFLASRGPGNLTVVAAANGIPLLGLAPHEHCGEHPPGPGQPAAAARPGAGNPHIWLDPVLAQGICRRIAAALIKVDPGHRAAYEANLQSYLNKLEALDREIRQGVATWRLHAFVSLHPSFSYLARRYHLREVGVMESAPGREPTPRHLQELLKSIRDCGLRVVFAEPQLSPRVAETIAREAGVRVLTLDPMGGRPPYGSDYLQLMRYNLAVMAEAMK